MDIIEKVDMNNIRLTKTVVENYSVQDLQRRKSLLLQEIAAIDNLLKIL